MAPLLLLPLKAGLLLVVLLSAARAGCLRASPRTFSTCWRGVPALFTCLGFLLFVPPRFELSAVEDAALGVGCDDGGVYVVAGEGDGLVAACR